MTDDVRLIECEACGRTGFRERIEDTACPHTDGGGRDHVERAVERLNGFACVCAVDVVPAAVDPSGEWVVEIVVEGATVPARVLGVLAEAGLGVRLAGSGTRGVPTHAVLVAEA